MEYGKSLIDKAGKVCGSFYKLHQETGFSEGNISKVRSGKRPLPLEWVPVLAEIAGEEPREALARVMAEQLPEGSRARAILGGVRAAGVAAMLLFFVVPALLLPSQSYAKGVTQNNPVYIVECLGRRFGRFAALMPRLRRAWLAVGRLSVFQSAKPAPMHAHFCTRIKGHC